MKETGIIMSGDHPKLILDGRKTMTRRVITPQPTTHLPYNPPDGLYFPQRYKCKGDPISRERLVSYCPYGQVGDRLWVREIWAAEKRYDHLKPSEIPDTAKIYYVDKLIHLAGGYSLFVELGKVRSSMFMCRWMSRITLEITELRVERLQEISLADCRKEGVEESFPQTLAGDVGGWEPRREFIQLWNSLNAKRGYGWETNPWVWVIGYENNS